MQKNTLEQIQYLCGVALLCALLGTGITHYIGHRWLKDGLDVIEIYYYVYVYGTTLFVTLAFIGSLLLSILRVNIFKRKQGILHWSIQCAILSIVITLCCLLFDYTIYYLYPNLPKVFGTEYEANENAHGRAVYNITQLLSEPMFVQFFLRNIAMIIAGAFTASLTAHFSIKRNKNVV